MNEQRHEQARRKPLYLDGKCGMQVYREGPSLRVVAEGSADRYFPLRRLSRIFAGQGVSFETAVLIACATQGVPLLILDREGETLVRVIGTVGQQDDLRQRLESFTGIPDWADRFHLWHTAMQRRVAGTLVKRLYYPRHLAARPRALCDYIDRKAKALAGREAALFSNRVLRQLCVSLMQRELRDRGLGAGDEAWQFAEVDLVDTLAELLSLRIQTIRLGWLRSRFGSSGKPGQGRRPLQRKELVHLFENNSARIERLARDLINRLHRWLVSSL
jgi:hypothetical protein